MAGDLRPLQRRNTFFTFTLTFWGKATVLLHKKLSVSISPSKMADHIRIAKVASQKLAEGGMKIITINIEQGNPEFPRLFADPESSD